MVFGIFLTIFSLYREKLLKITFDDIHSFRSFLLDCVGTSLICRKEHATLGGNELAVCWMERGNWFREARMTGQNLFLENKGFVTS